MTRPTHMHMPTGALVFPGGYDDADLEVIPADYWIKADADAKLADLRARRDAELDATDAMMVSDRGLSDAALGQWKAYRQALRDITEGERDWPIKPERQEPDIAKGSTK